MQTFKLKGKQGRDQYTDLQYLTSGGMGDLYTAIDSTSNNKVAIKIIRINNVVDKDLLAEEFKIATSLSHECIVETYYYDEFKDPSGEYFYAVMEYSEFGSLRRLLISASTNFTIKKSLTFFNDLLEGLEEAHKFIIHRDLKPENILISKNGNLQICDFGIAKYVNMLTRTKTFKGYGSYPYMPPECWDLDKNTVQMDIYSLGIIFYEILCLQYPFKGPTEREFRRQHLYELFPSFSSVRNDVPFIVQEVIRKMTAKNSRDRYNNVGEILKILNAEKPAAEVSANIGMILQNVESKTKAILDAELAAQKIKDEQEEWTNGLNFSVKELFNQFAAVGDSVNTHLQTNKLNYKSFLIHNPYASHFRLNFFSRMLEVSFFNYDIRKYVADERKRQLEFQQNKFGMVLQSPESDQLEIDRVLLVGKAVLNISRSNRFYGFNLILRKENQDDLYGKWWICKFFDNPIARNYIDNFYYAIDAPEFFIEYNYGRKNVMHVRNMGFNFFSNDIFTELIALMPNL